MLSITTIIPPAAAAAGHDVLPPNSFRIEQRLSKGNPNPASKYIRGASR